MILNYLVDFVLDSACDRERQDLCDQILEKNPEHVFLNLAWEPYEFNSNMLSVDQFLFDHGIPATWLVLNWSEQDPAWGQLKCPVIFIDFVLWRVYNEIVVRKTNKTNQKWNPNADRYLFLTGKPDKVQRIGLLHQLHVRKLLDKCDHSFFMSPGMYENSRRILPMLSDQEFNEFVQKYQRNLDGIEPDMQQHSMHYGGIPYNPDIYARSRFRLVSESTMFLKPSLISEKTYLTILNKNPFVIAGDVESCKRLMDMGIQPFDCLFTIPTYDNIKPVSLRLTQVIAHVEQWLAGNFNKTEVDDMVEHNYIRFVELGKEIKEKFESSTGVDIDLAIDSKDSNHIARSKGW